MHIRLNVYIPTCTVPARVNVSTAPLPSFRMPDATIDEIAMFAAVALAVAEAAVCIHGKYSVFQAI